MKKQVKDFISNSYQIFRDKGEYDMDIKQVLSLKHENGTTGYQAIAISSSDPDVIICICDNISEKKDYQHIPEWDYNMEDYFFSDLENGYEIEFMTIDEHCGLCKMIDCSRDEISHVQGLQTYLSFCQQNDINSHVISLYSSESIEIFDLYHERNEAYSIISETNLGPDSVVLGYNADLIFPYVTWATTPDRKYGYRLGHYLSSYTEAFQDYKQRCSMILDRHLEFEKKRTKPEKDKNKYER